MRKLILLGLFLTFVVPAWAVDRITVAELEKRIAASTAHHAGVPVPIQRLEEDALAQELGNLLLEERLTSARQEQIAKKYAIGPRLIGAVQLLGARSALLDPPKDEFPDIPPPNAETQHRMIGEAGTFAFQTLKRLPNFFAMRTTTRAIGNAPDLNKNGMVLRMGLTPAGSSSREITYRDGREVIEPTKAGGATPLPEMGVETWGKFGPEPAVVLIDAAKGTIAFHHWEQTPTGLAAVYHYAVPRANSHYEVNYSCLGSALFHDYPGYHGSLSIDPTSGAILRITLEADWKEGDPLTHVASVIEYGPVEIGERSYVCPLRSIAVAVEEPNAACAHNGHSARALSKLGQPVLGLNQTSFTNYHRLASTHKLVFKDEELPLPAPDSSPDGPSTPASIPSQPKGS